MPETVDPADIPEVTDKEPCGCADVTVSDVMLAVESLQLTVDTVLRMVCNLVLSAALFMLGLMLADLIFP